MISRGTGESEESIINRQTALYSLKLLSRLLAKDHPSPFKEVCHFSLLFTPAVMLQNMLCCQSESVTQILLCFVCLGDVHIY